MSSTLPELLFKDYRRRVLNLLLLHPDKQYHVREIARLTGTVAGTLHKELARLAKAGVLVKEAVGNQVQYRANTECPIYKELRRILEKLAGSVKEDNKSGQMKMSDIIEKYRSQILLLAKENGVRNVRVFGSMARNESGPDSDLDLLVDIEKGQSGLALGGFLYDVSELVHRKVDVVTENSLHPRIRERVLHEARAL
ncbi:MAG: nucleotidyltransferase domain-containing protein [Pseudomonadota bacterium]|nr:nucleotidyltransferase domain-containing protein [Pseudomonadota bacterium]